MNPTTINGVFISEKVYRTSPCSISDIYNTINPTIGSGRRHTTRVILQMRQTAEKTKFRCHEGGQRAVGFRARSLRPPSVNVDFLKELNSGNGVPAKATLSLISVAYSPNLPPKMTAHRRIRTVDADKCTFVRRSRASNVRLGPASISMLLLPPLPVASSTVLPFGIHTCVGRSSAYPIIMFICSEGI